MWCSTYLHLHDARLTVSDVLLNIIHMSSQCFQLLLQFLNIPFILWIFTNKRFFKYLSITEKQQNVCLDSKILSLIFRNQEFGTNFHSHLGALIRIICINHTYVNSRSPVLFCGKSVLDCRKYSSILCHKFYHLFKILSIKNAWRVVPQMNLTGSDNPYLL